MGIHYFITNAKRYGLRAKYVNENTVSLYSPKFFFDSWLIIKTSKGYDLMHLNKSNKNVKCTYHRQSYCGERNRYVLLEAIKKHNIYKAFYKKRNKVNLVDRTLNKQRRVS